MKNITLLFLVFLAGIFLSGCASIVGGNRYFANIEVPSNPDAEIKYMGMVVGRGRAMVELELERENANKFSFLVTEDGCDPVNFNFYTRDFRGWAMVGSYFTFGVIGLIVDAVSGACWRPDLADPRIHRLNTKNYLYQVNLPPCEADKENDTEKERASVAAKYQIRLFNGKTIIGKILENIPGKHLKIETDDKAIQAIPMEEVIDFSELK
jgi:hypothetical protein